MTTAADTSPRFWARTVGVLYLLMIAVGSIPLLVGRVRVSNDAAAMATAILGHPSQVHTAFAASLLVVVCYLPVPVLFYKLFKPVNDTLSLTAAFFGLAGCAVQGFACLFRIAPLIVLTSGQSLRAMSREQVQSLAYLLVKLYTPAYNISLVFFAFAFILIGCLVFKSTFLPRFLGVLAVIAGFGWMPFLWPPLAELLWPRVILPLDIGELALVLWLLIAGVNVERWHEQANAAKE
jgi:hypothetical protein